MRIHGNNLGLFVPGSVNMKSLQTSVSLSGVRMRDVRGDYSGGLGEFVPGCFTVPQVPVRTSLSGLGCSSCQNKGMGAMSDMVASVESGDFSGALMNADIVPPLPNIVVIGAAVYLAFSIFGDSKRVVASGRSRGRAARAAYKAALA